MKKVCTKYHAWHAKKGMLLTLVCFEVNLASMPRHTWWIDSSATTHICVSMQGCLNYQKPIDAKRFIYVGDGKTIEVEEIGQFMFLLSSGCYLDLKDTFVVPSFRRILASISTLDISRHCCSFGNDKFSLSFNSDATDTGSLSSQDNLYLLDTIASYNETFHVSAQGAR